MPPPSGEFPHPSRYMLPPFLMEPEPVALIGQMTDHEPGVRLSRPLITGWLMTYRCSLKCRHCWVTRHVAEASPAERAIIAGRLADGGVCRVALSGGEVTLLPDLADCVDILKRGGTPVSIYTNGADLGDMEWLRSWDHQLDYVQVSIDGGSPETHEAQRGRGTFRRLEAGLARLKDERVRVVAHYVATPWNGGDLREAALFASRYGCEAFVAEMYIASGRAADQGRTVMEGVAQGFIRSAEELLADDVLMSGPMPVHLALPCVVPFPGWYADPLRGAWNVRLRRSSPYGTTHCFVVPDGNVFPTPAVADNPAYNSGSLLEHDLLSLWRYGEGFSRFPTTRDLRGTLCDGCPDLVICGGGCDKRAFALTGTFDHHDPWCHRSPAVSAAAL